MNIRTFKWLLVLAAGILFTACEKEAKTEPKPKHAVLGSYEQAGQRFDILQAHYALEQGYYQFIFAADAPLPGAKVSSYCSLAVRQSLIGQEFHPEAYVKNLDYIFVFEDPRYYYSPYKSIEGTIQVMDKGENRFEVSMDLTLIDGTAFRLSLDNVVSLAAN